MPYVHIPHFHKKTSQVRVGGSPYDLIQTNYLGNDPASK